jgi:UDP-2,3-diacylglucosamine pyrophosphatase LpxH
MVQQQEVNKTIAATNKQPTYKEIDSKNHNSSNSVDKDNSINKGRPNVINIDKAIIVSDLHLGYKKCNSKAFSDFLSEFISRGASKEYSLFILGDFWDLWRKHDIIYSTESDEILSLVNQFKDVYYLPGNHDYITLDAAHNYPDFNCYNISKYFRIKSGEKNFYLVHGHELEVISKLISMKLSEYEKISDQLCRMNDTEGNIASYLHETFHRVFTRGQPQITDFLQTAEQRKGMDAIDKFAKSKARYVLLGMQLDDILIFGHTHRPYIDFENNVINTGGWLADMVTPRWFEDQYGQDKACSGWYVEINNNGEYKLVPYGIHQKTKEEMRNSELKKQQQEQKKDNKNYDEDKDKQNENIVSKVVSQVGDMVKQVKEPVPSKRTSEST